MSEKKSQHPIMDSLLPFLKEDKPDYAIMIDGKWGSGKTYFLKNDLFGSEETDVKNKSFWYASANGAKTFEDIASQLILNQNGNGNLKKGLKIAKSLITSVNAISYSDILSMVPFNKSNVIVIDDLERVDQSCDLIGLLGQINTTFVEHNNIKTILVCDEEELKKRFSGDGVGDRKLKGNEPNYTESKGKLVRRTVKFSLELINIYDALITNLKCKGSIKTLLKSDKKNYLQDCVQIQKIENLRDIIFFIENFAIVLEEFTDLKKGQELFEYICQTVWIWSMEFRNGNLTKDDLPKYQDGLLGVQILAESPIVHGANSNGNNTFQKLKRKYPQHFKPQFYSIKLFIVTGHCDEEKLNSELSDAYDSMFISEESKVIRELEKWFELADDNLFDDKLQLIKKNFLEGKYAFDQFLAFFNRIEYFIEFYRSQLISLGHEEFKDHQSFELFCIHHLNKVKLPEVLDYHFNERISHMLSISPPQHRYLDLKDEIEKRVQANQEKYFHKMYKGLLDQCITNKTIEYTQKADFLIVLNTMSMEDLTPFINLYIENPPFRYDVRKTFDSVFIRIENKQEFKAKMDDIIDHISSKVQNPPVLLSMQLDSLRREVDRLVIK